MEPKSTVLGVCLQSTYTSICFLNPLISAMLSVPKLAIGLEIIIIIAPGSQLKSDNNNIASSFGRNADQTDDHQHWWIIANSRCITV